MGKKLYTFLSLALASTAAFAEQTYNLTEGVTPISHDIYELHMLIFWVCVAIGIVVFGVMFYAMIYHRKSRGAQPANFHEHFWLEITWTIVPVIILILMAIPASKVLIQMYDTSQEEVTIKITGYQWKWHYEYMEDGISFFSNLATPWDQIRSNAPKGANYLREVDNVLVLPIHKKVRFLITSNDVNHAWWVADLGVKRDAIPGYINEAWARVNKPGTYHGQCAEMCGINHAYMPIVVVAKSEADYQAWVAQKKGGGQPNLAELSKQWTITDLMNRGKAVYASVCAACHQTTGEGMPPSVKPIKGSPVAKGPISKHIDTVMNGVPGTAMQAFKAQLDDVDLAAVITYERNAFDNNTGTFVQPLEIKAAREGKTVAQVQAELKTAAAAAPTSAKTSSTSATVTTPAAAPAAGEKPSAAAPAPTATPVAAAPAAPAAAAAPTDKVTLVNQMQQGAKVYLNTCAACHQPTGLGMPPTFPALKGSKIATGPVTDHLNIVLFGKPGTAMQAFKDQLSDADLSAVITYERNAWGNDTGTVVQPADVQAAKAKGN